MWSQILEDVIKHRWGAIDDTQREGIKNYLSNLIIKISSDEVTLRREKVYLNKLNIILVQVCHNRRTHMSKRALLATTDSSHSISGRQQVELWAR
jgi:hypothetical protein